MYIRAITVVLSVVLGYMIRIIIEKRCYAGKLLIDYNYNDGPRVLLQQDIPLSKAAEKKQIIFKVDPHADLSQKNFSLVNSDDSKI